LTFRRAERFTDDGRCGGCRECHHGLCELDLDARSPARQASEGDPLVPLPGCYVCPPVDRLTVAAKRTFAIEIRHAAPRGGGPPTPGPPPMRNLPTPSDPGRLARTTSGPASRKPLRSQRATLPAMAPGPGRHAWTYPHAGRFDRPSSRELPQIILIGERNPNWGYRRITASHATMGLVKSPHLRLGDPDTPRLERSPADRGPTWAEFLTERPRGC